jgi:hypothetical protein
VPALVTSAGQDDPAPGFRQYGERARREQMKEDNVAKVLSFSCFTSFVFVFLEGIHSE